MESINIKNKDKLYYVVSRIFFVLSFLIIWFFIISQINFKKNYEDNLAGWCYQYDEEWIRVNPDGSTVHIDYPINEHAEPGQDIVLETILPKSINDDAIFCMLVGRNTWFYIDGELRGKYLESDCPFPGGMAKNRIAQIELSGNDAGKTMRIVRNDTRNNYIGISEAYLGNGHGIYNNFFEKYGMQMNSSILLAVLSIMSILVIIFVSVRNKKLNTVIYLCCGIFLLGLWLIMDNPMFQYNFGTYFVDGLMAYIAIMLTPFFFIYYLDKAQNGRYHRLYGVLNLILLINFFTFGILHFTSTINFADSMIFMNIVLSVVITGIAYTLIRDFTTGNIREYKYIAIGLFALAVCGIIEIIVLNVCENNRLDGLFIVIGLYILLFMAIIHLVKQSEKMKEKAIDAMRANKLKSNFLANMSHEIRTPLNAIMGLNEMIYMEDVNEKVKGYSSNIKSAGTNLLSIIGDILDFSMIESGKMEITNSEYDSASLIYDMETAIKLWSKDKKLDFQIVIDKKLPCSLSGDEKRIKQIGINLLSNAVKYTDKGYIRLNIYGKEEKGDFILVIAVSDSGIGIKEEDKDKLFRKFERITTNRYIEGTGLGLSITANLVELMKGTITVESEYKKGSVFTVELPQKIVDATPIGDYRTHIKYDDVTTRNTAIKAENAHILVVDDNNMNLMVAKGLLNNTGMQVDTCSSGREMLKVITEKYYDIILLDHMMPEMDGIEAMHESKKLENNKCINTPIIVMTANAVKGVREQYLEEGFADYISKPVSGEVLIKTIIKHLNKSLVSEAEIPATENDIDIPEIKEFDLKYAMNLVGDKKILMELLIDYAQYIKDIGTKISELTDDTKQYGILVHSLKSSSANVGDLTVSRLARLLEIAAEENDTERIKTLTPILHEELKSHYRALDNILPKTDNVSEEFDEDKIRSILNDIKDSLNRFDYTSAEQCITQLKTYEFSKEQGVLVKEIKMYIDDFEPEKAIEFIEKLVNIL